MSWVTASPTVSPPGHESFESSATSPARVSPKASCAAIRSATFSVKVRKSSVRATKSVSQLTSTSTAPLTVTWATTSPSEAARPALEAAAARPFLRRIFLASSKSPSASTSAFLQSIMPAPVSARRSDTSLDEISMVPL